jgi:hypothetical protein
MNLSFRFQYLNQLIGGHFDVNAISVRERHCASTPDRRILLYLRHVFGVHVANVTARIGDFNKLGHRFLPVSRSIARSSMSGFWSSQIVHATRRDPVVAKANARN